MNVRQVLAENDIAPSRRQDQHFLVDEEILDYEIKLANLENDDIVLEIGAGIGNLTEKITKKAKVIAIESDRRFLPLLENLDNVEIINANALSVIRKLNFNKVISNIPYAISQSLLLTLLKTEWQVAVLVVQREFAKKLKNGKLAILLEDCADVKIIDGISADAFYPRGVASSIVVLKQKALMDDKFWGFLNRAYRSRNRDVKNVFPDCGEAVAKKKVHQLTSKELKSLYHKVARL
jgi:16S rRNA (adenine1518-N6/adenine1519-N6)-dimethyltransferase